MERAFRDEVIAAGGSVAEKDIARVAARLQAYLRLGLHGVSEEPEQIAAIVARCRCVRSWSGVGWPWSSSARSPPPAPLRGGARRAPARPDAALTHLQPAVEPETGAAARCARRRPAAAPGSRCRRSTSTWVPSPPGWRSPAPSGCAPSLKSSPPPERLAGGAGRLAVSSSPTEGGTTRSQSGALRAPRPPFRPFAGPLAAGTEERVRQAVRSGPPRRAWSRRRGPGDRHGAGRVRPPGGVPARAEAHFLGPICAGGDRHGDGGW